MIDHLPKLAAAVVDVVALAQHATIWKRVSAWPWWIYQEGWADDVFGLMLERLESQIPPEIFDREVRIPLTRCYLLSLPAEGGVQ
ncbi:hypothetical protein CCC_02286 [Paramagnetospirillum magnetotacticum MS-1]|uniref:Uncharacterized protein n=1 Tax=Paramagnetospirillum magnetotacticum MS-1 TaxID=272627 RepID=A0A0C2V184_PARME|nr:hypothetical protein [Paramagnetospirillum magnetotacticum]KIL98836.1 hypothetical protein CCC_02286 [Paramagnetospirillum magnetotacticum MS-1]